MAIRLRVINGIFVALNARKTENEEGDIYINDAFHHALSTKFGVDFKSMGFIDDDLADEVIKRAMLDEEWKCTCPDSKLNPECAVHKSKS